MIVRRNMYSLPASGSRYDLVTCQYYMSAGSIQQCRTNIIGVNI